MDYLELLKGTGLVLSGWTGAWVMIRRIRVNEKAGLRLELELVQKLLDSEREGRKQDGMQARIDMRNCVEVHRQNSIQKIYIHRLERAVSEAASMPPIPEGYVQ